MKRTVMLLPFVLLHIYVSAQNWSGATPGNIYYNSGNVGIENTNPLSPLVIGGTVGTNIETNGITLSSHHNVIEFINSNYSLGYGAKVYGMDEGSGRTSFRVAVRGNSTVWQDALYIGASDVNGANNGLVGVGTSTPIAKLHVGAMPTTWTNNSWGKAIQIDGNQAIAFKTPEGNYYSFGAKGNDRFFIGSTSAEDNTGGSMNYLVTLMNDNVLIGKLSQTNTTYKLDVAGKVRANEIVVNTTGADYVFAEDYQLRGLEEVEDFIEQHGHLPGIPSAEEMQEEGMAVGELNKKLLEKVEELTLYLIEMKEENELLKVALSDLINKIENLER